jgi:hypothetical protein
LLFSWMGEREPKERFLIWFTDSWAITPFATYLYPILVQKSVTLNISTSTIFFLVIHMCNCEGLAK